VADRERRPLLKKAVSFEKIDALFEKIYARFEKIYAPFAETKKQAMCRGTSPASVGRKM
jgi:hypothetical protein